MTVATTCIAKGDEITHIYQGHFGDTAKDERQRILMNMFHFDCLCKACVNDYPRVGELPDSYSVMAKLVLNDTAQSSQLQMFKNNIEKYNYDINDPKSKSNMLIREISNTIRRKKTPQDKKIIAIFKSLEENHDTINKELFQLIESKNIDEALRLYCERIRIACVFLIPPHMIFLNGRAAITDCLWVKYGNKAYGVSSSSLSGAYV